jgi:bifunctional UDP-N-acetylglucosamine pyrophosphorylase/glucosamine-1-phosphate N-acetyltransferase
MKTSICAVVPAAGTGSRLGSDCPKVFAPLSSSVTVWDAIRDNLLPVAGKIVLVLSPQGGKFLESKDFSSSRFERTELAFQKEPRGMGDAIFGAAARWKEFDHLLVVWGDQFNLSGKTLRACVDLHLAQRGPRLTLPLVKTAQPYVEYVFEENRLKAIRQSREGDLCRPGGFSDIGVFLLTGGQPLLKEWGESWCDQGARTGEINFLPFLVHLSSRAGWPVHCYECDDPAEAVGINTPQDLAFARRLWQKKAGSHGDFS